MPSSLRWYTVSVLQTRKGYLQPFLFSLGSFPICLRDVISKQFAYIHWPVANIPNRSASISCLALIGFRTRIIHNNEEINPLQFYMWGNGFQRGPASPPRQSLTDGRADIKDIAPDLPPLPSTTHIWFAIKTEVSILLHQKTMAQRDAFYWVQDSPLQWSHQFTQYSRNTQNLRCCPVSFFWKPQHVVA